MKNFIKIIAPLIAATWTSFAWSQQVDQPAEVLLDIDVWASTETEWNPSIPGYEAASARATFKAGTTTLFFEDEDADGSNYTPDIKALIPVGEEIDVKFEVDYLWNLELFITPPPGYMILINDEPTGYYQNNGLGGVGYEEFTAKMKVLAIGGNEQMALGDASIPEIGKFRWDIGLGNMPNGRSAGMLTIRELLIGDIYKRENIGFGSAPYTEFDVLRDGNGDLLRIRTDVLVDISDITDGFEIKIYPAGEFDATEPDLSDDVGLALGDPFRRITAEKLSGSTDVELKVYDVQGGTSTLMIMHTVKFDSTADKWTLESGDGSTIKRTETYDYGSGRANATIVVKEGSTEARKTYKTFASVAQGSDVTEIRGDYGVKNYTTTFDYTGTATDWLQKVQNPDGSWTHSVYDMFGRPDIVYSPFKNSSSTPGAYTSGVTVEYEYDDAPAASSASAGDVLVAVRAWSSVEYKDLPSSVIEKTNGTVTGKSLIDYSQSTLNSRTTIIADRDEYFSTTGYLTTVSKRYSSLLTGTDALFASLPVSVENPDGTKTAWLHQPGSYTEGSSTLTAFTPSSAYDPATSNKYWRTIVFNGRSSGSGTISSFATGSGNAIDPIYMEKDKSTIQVTIRGYQGRVVQREVYVFTGSTSTSASSTSNYSKIDWVRNEYKPEWGHRLWRSKSIRTETGHYDAEYSYDDGRIDYSINGIGQKYTFDYDELGRVVQKTLRDNSNNAERSTLTWYNAAGDVTGTARISGRLSSIPSSPSGLTSSPRLVSTAAYDKGGWLTETIDEAGVEIDYSYTKTGNFVLDYVRSQSVPSPTNPASTVTASITEKRHYDGRTEKVTGDTVKKFYSYTVATGAGSTQGQMTTRESIDSSTSVRYSEETRDLLGRVVEKEVPKNTSGVLTETFEYHTSGYGEGKLKKWTAPGRDPILYEYDSLGNLSREGLDYSNGGTLALASEDRIKDYETKVVDFSSAKFLEQSVYGYPTDNSSTKVLHSRTRDRLTGFYELTVPTYPTVARYNVGKWIASEKYTYDFDSNTSTTNYASIQRIYIDPDGADREVYSANYLRGETYPALTKSVDGLLQETRTIADVKTSFTYDALGRRETVVSRENGIYKVIEKTVFKTNSQLIDELLRTRTSSTPNQVVADYEYFANGALKSMQNADGELTYYLYNKRGQQTHRWGTAEDPVKFVYNDYGDRTEMHTYQAGTWTGTGLPSSFGSATPSKTVWDIEASTGLVEEKRDAGYDSDSSRKVSFTYDSVNRLDVVTLARGGTVNHDYDTKTGELTEKDYSDVGMTDIVYTYDRLGMLETVADVTGTRTFNYRSADRRLDYVSLPSTFYGSNRQIKFGYDTNRRARNKYEFGTTTDSDAYYRSDWTWSNGRISNVKAFDRNSVSSRTFTYGFATNSNLIASLTTTGVGANSWTQTRTYRNYENFLESSDAKWGTTRYARTDYVYDTMGRMTSANSWGDLYDGFGAGDALNYDFTYHADGRLESALGHTVDGGDSEVDLSSRNFYYDYDKAGNRDWSSQVADGSVDSDHKKDYTADLTNAYSGIDNPVNDVFSGEVSGTPSVYDNERGGYIPSGELTKPGGGTLFQHIFDTTTGNTTTAEYDRWFWFSNPALDWQSWVYPAISESPTYDKDGNLTSDGRFSYTYDLENRLIQVGNSADRMSFKYDYMGRRVEAKFEENVSSVWTEPWTKRYVYDGWHLIAEFDASTKNIGNTFFWGYDISHSIGGAGTIGGLLMQDDGTNQYIPGYDGRGNVVLYISEATGSIVAELEYDPYGVLLRKDGDYDKFPFRYQTKWDMDSGCENEPTYSLYYSWGLTDYGLRWYQPGNGRFINRDPIGEAGGINLYEAFGGDPLNRWDLLGLDVLPTVPNAYPVGRHNDPVMPPDGAGDGWFDLKPVVSFSSSEEDSGVPELDQGSGISMDWELDWQSSATFLGWRTQSYNNGRRNARLQRQWDIIGAGIGKRIRIKAQAIAASQENLSPSSTDEAQSGKTIPEDALKFQVGDRYRTIRGGDPVSFGGSLGDTFVDMGTDFLQSGADISYRAINLANYYFYEWTAGYNLIVAATTVRFSGWLSENFATEATGQLHMLGGEFMGTPAQGVMLGTGALDISAHYFTNVGPAAESNVIIFSNAADSALDSALKGPPPKP